MTIPIPIGPVISRRTVERAVITTLQTWLGAVYLPHQERLEGLAPRSIPRPGRGEERGLAIVEAIYGGLDFNNYDAELSPAVIVNLQPVEDAELRGSGNYNQWYEIQVAAICTGADEHEARLRADVYGAAIMATLAQQGDFGELADRTRMMIAPHTEFIADNERIRRGAQSIATFHTLILAVVNEAGPTSVVSDGQVPPGPYVAETVDVDLDVYPIDAPIPSE